MWRADTASVKSVSGLMEGRSAQRVAHRSETTTAGLYRDFWSGMGGLRSKFDRQKEAHFGRRRRNFSGVASWALCSFENEKSRPGFRAGAERLDGAGESVTGTIALPWGS